MSRTMRAGDFVDQLESGFGEAPGSSLGFHSSTEPEKLSSVSVLGNVEPCGSTSMSVPLPWRTRVLAGRFPSLPPADFSSVLVKIELEESKNSCGFPRSGSSVDIVARTPDCVWGKTSDLKTLALFLGPPQYGKSVKRSIWGPPIEQDDITEFALTFVLQQDLLLDIVDTVPILELGRLNNPSSLGWGSPPWQHITQSKTFFTPCR